ncbi:cell surface glycoprotein CD200 receptor 5-like isoform X2 [Anguilla anguilla]|uniref:cell surface glycoprotein CD200 receptor 5-like isoform X2 n=1 Tax=Anguilla anguilla TaxID=7936 RepID=UPI0015AC296C|nr:cell surface glycoprotein CD200 receptor 5-like isoform X2 [Anguilla anguilla]
MVFKRHIYAFISIVIVGFVQGQSTTSPGTFTTTKPLFTDHRTEKYTIGKSVNLTCTNKTWTEMFYTTWRIPRNGNHCTIAASTDKPPHDTCLDGKVMRNTSNGESYLHIPIFKVTDIGIYRCETAFQGASLIAEITVSAIVSPQIFTRLVIIRDGKREAVCSAIGGKPAASISWRNTWNSSVTQTSKNNTDGSFTVESRLIVPEHVPSDNLSCIITHPSWTELHILRVSPASEAPHFSLKKVGISMSCVIVPLGILAVFCIIRKFPKKSQDVKIHGLQTIHAIIEPSKNCNPAESRRQESEILGGGELCYTYVNIPSMML